MKYTQSDILNLDRRFRANFINAVSGIKSANLIGTCNIDGQTNLAIFNSVMHIGANPPLLSIMVRPHTVERHTYENIKATGYYTINAVNKDLIERAHQTSGKYPKGVSEFMMCDIKPCFSSIHPAPYVAESNIQIGLKLEEEHHIRSNQTILLVGRIVELNVAEHLVKEDGHLDLAKVGLIGVNGLDSYCQSSKWKTLPYFGKADIEL